MFIYNQYEDYYDPACFRNAYNRDIQLSAVVCGSETLSYEELHVQENTTLREVCTPKRERFIMLHKGNSHDLYGNLVLFV
jgi:hypothetical protein